jgi:hypothetical protein
VCKRHYSPQGLIKDGLVAHPAKLKIARRAQGYIEKKALGPPLATQKIN